jgi:hypothetical protein
MTAKEFTKERFPNARAEKQIRGRIKGMQEVYYLIHDGRNTMYMSCGNSISNAWVNAKKSILNDAVS